jgi:hypothetical protein
MKVPDGEMATRGEFDAGPEAKTAVSCRGVSPERECIIGLATLTASVI